PRVLWQESPQRAGAAPGAQPAAAARGSDLAAGAPAMNPSDAEQQSRQVRAELGETVDALARKLAARQLVEKGCDMITDTLDRYDAVNRSLELIRANPIPLALIGIGAAWLIAANTVPEEQIVAARRKMSDMAGDLGNRAG